MDLFALNYIFSHTARLVQGTNIDSLWIASDEDWKGIQESKT